MLTAFTQTGHLRRLVSNLKCWLIINEIIANKKKEKRRSHVLTHNSNRSHGLRRDQTRDYHPVDGGDEGARL